jgi:broad specificity phosphatase PhoE
MVRIERVLLVRHGQTDWNVTGRWQGSEPVPLNGDGWAQARALAEYLRDRPIKAIYSSDLPRAWQTAVTIGQALGIDPRADPRWQEFNLGIFQGYTREEMQIRFPMEWEQFRENYWDYVVPQGESRRMFQNRVYAAWKDMIAESTGPEVLVVSHGGSIKHLLLKLFEDDPTIHEVHIENTSVTTLERHGEHWQLTGVAAIPHL